MPLLRKARIRFMMIFVFTASGLLTTGCGHFGMPAPSSAAASDSAMTAVIDLYQGPLDHMAPVRQGVCPMYPNCSEYGREAIERHGFLKGWMMTCDRLIRCGRDELSHSPEVRVEGKTRCYDPVENNEWGDDLHSDRTRQLNSRSTETIKEQTFPIQHKEG